MPEEPSDRTEAKWKVNLVSYLRFVDDGFNLSAINLENSYGFEVNGVFWRSKPNNYNGCGQREGWLSG